MGNHHAQCAPAHPPEGRALSLSGSPGSILRGDRHLYGRRLACGCEARSTESLSPLSSVEQLMPSAVLSIREAREADDQAIWRILEPVIRDGTTYALPSDMTETD